MRQAEPIHISDENLELYSMGRVPDGELDTLEDHLLICAHCQDRLTEAQEFTRIMKTAVARVEREPRLEAVPFWRRFFASPHPVWAAAAAMAVALVFVLPVRERQPDLVQLVAMRGGEPGVARAHAGRPLELSLPTESIPVAPAYAVEIVSSNGKAAWQGEAKRLDGAISVNVPGELEPGRYWVRLYDLPGKAELLREYALVVE